MNYSYVVLGSQVISSWKGGTSTYILLLKTIPILVVNKGGHGLVMEQAKGQDLVVVTTGAPAMPQNSSKDPQTYT